MSETIGSTSESKRVSTPFMQSRQSLAWLLVFLGLAAVLISAMEIRTWRRLSHLEKTLRQANLQSFRLGLQVRESVMRLNGFVFRFQLSDLPEERDGFHAEARQLRQWIAEAPADPGRPDGAALLAEIDRELDKYLEAMAPRLQRGLRGIRRDTPKRLHEELIAQAQPLLRLADQLVEVQDQTLHTFWTQTEDTLRSLQQLLALSLVLLVVLGISAAVLVYGVAILPLRHRLTASEAAVARQEKLASLGVLAAGIAHEVRNPLTAVKFRLFSLKRSLPEEHRDHEDLNVIHGEINRLERIVQDFLHFARPSEPNITTIDADDLLRHVVNLMQAQLHARGIALELKAGEPASLSADREQLQQVLMNLVQNAAESMGDRGTVTLSVRRGSAQLHGRPQRPAAIIEVSDTGPGIPPDVAQRIFDPFFSTKEAGTGLGLAVAARVIEKHGGAIQFRSELRHGTTFSIVLPTDT